MKNIFYKLPKEVNFEPGSKITMSTLYGIIPKKKIYFKEYLHNFLVIFSSILLCLFIIMCGIIIAKRLNKKYVYVDMNGSTGKSQSCYYSESSRDMRCLIPVKVQQYSEEK